MIFDSGVNDLCSILVFSTDEHLDAMAIKYTLVHRWHLQIYFFISHKRIKFKKRLEIKQSLRLMTVKIRDL
jgi:hypothetical protein